MSSLNESRLLAFSFLHSKLWIEQKSKSFAELHEKQRKATSFTNVHHCIRLEKNDEEGYLFWCNDKRQHQEWEQLPNSVQK